MSFEESLTPNEHPVPALLLGQQTPETRIKIKSEISPANKSSGFVKFQIDETPRNDSATKSQAEGFYSLDSPIQSPLVSLRVFGSTIYKPSPNAEFIYISEPLDWKWPSSEIKINFDADVENRPHNRLRNKRENVVIQDEV